jgi:DNA-binding transcriptional LysR family regulator
VDFSDVREFVALADTLSYTKAAQSLSMSRSSLILHVSKLGRQLGAPLVEKSGRKLALTVSGRLFLDYARQILRLCDDSAAALLNQREATDRHVKVAYPGVPELFGLTEIVEEFRKNDQNLECEVLDTPFDQLPELLKNGGCDLFFYRALPNQDTDPLEDFQTVTYLSDTLVLLMPLHHWMTMAPKITLDKLHQESLILHNAPVITHYIKALCNPSGTYPLITHANRTLDSIASMVTCNLGCTMITTRSARNLRCDDAQFRSLTPPVPSDLLLVWRKDAPLNAAGEHFLHCAQAFGAAQAEIISKPLPHYPKRLTAASKRATSVTFYPPAYIGDEPPGFSITKQPTPPKTPEAPKVPETPAIPASSPAPEPPSEPEPPVTPEPAPEPEPPKAPAEPPKGILLFPGCSWQGGD